MKVISIIILAYMSFCFFCLWAYTMDIYKEEKFSVIKHIQRLAKNPIEMCVGLLALIIVILSSPYRLINLWIIDR